MTTVVRKISIVSWLVKAFSKSIMPYKSGTGIDNDANEVIQFKCFGFQVWGFFSLFFNEKKYFIGSHPP